MLIAAWLVLFVYAYPGWMTVDSFDHLAEARGGVYTDGHPPAISFLWKLVEYVIAGGFGMLILQSAAFLLGLYAILRHTLSPRGAAWAAALVFVFPPVFSPFAVIWKDCLMAGFTMLGLAALLDERRGIKLAGLAALVIATAVRYNAFAATLPIIVLVFEWRPGMGWVKRHAIAAAAWVGVTLAAFGLNAALTDKEMHYWHSSLAVYDIVGTLAKLDHELSDAELERRLAGTGLLVHDHIHAKARALFTPRYFASIISDERRRFWNMPTYGSVVVPEATRDAIARAWRDIVTSYPLAYLRYRLAVMAEVMCIGHRRPLGAVGRIVVFEFSWAQGIPTSVSPVQLGLTSAMMAVWTAVPVFLPWMYALLGFAVGGLALANRRSRDALALCASGLVMEATLFFLAPSADYRYSHWLVVSVCAAIVIVMARRGGARQLGSRPAAEAATPEGRSTVSSTGRSAGAAVDLAGSH